MKFLLDTHTLLWWDSEPTKLSARVLSICLNDTNTLYISIVSIWELQIKCQIGKLTLNKPLSETVESQFANGLRLLPLLPEHIYALDQLPLFHKDPFDRALIAQAITESIPILSVDSNFAQYPVTVIW